MLSKARISVLSGTGGPWTSRTSNSGRDSLRACLIGRKSIQRRQLMRGTLDSFHADADAISEENLNLALAQDPMGDLA